MLGLLFVVLFSSAFTQAPAVAQGQFPIDGTYDVVSNPLSQWNKFQPAMFHMMAQTVGSPKDGKDWFTHAPTRTVKLVIYDDNREYFAGDASLPVSPNNVIADSFSASDGHLQFTYRISLSYYGKIATASMEWSQPEGTIAKLHLSGEVQSQEGVLTLTKGKLTVSALVFLPKADFQLPLPNQSQKPIPRLIGYSPATPYSAVNGWNIEYGPSSVFHVNYIFINGLYGYDLVMS